MPIKSFDTLENLLQFSDYPKVAPDTATPPGHGGGMEPLEWMKLLHRQELIHQMEMEKWHDLIGAATELLRQVMIFLLYCFFTSNRTSNGLSFQTEHSLSDLQKSIHPLALQKMRGLMFLQNDDWERILSHQHPSAQSNLHHQHPSEQHHYKSTTAAVTSYTAGATTTSEKTTTNSPSQSPEGAKWTPPLPAEDMSLSRDQQ